MIVIIVQMFTNADDFNIDLYGQDLNILVGFLIVLLLPLVHMW